MTNQYFIILQLLLLSCHCASLPGWLHKDKSTGAIFYVTYVYLGSPGSLEQLVVDFSINNIQTTVDQSGISGTYSPAMGGSDIVLISGVNYRLPVQTLPLNDPIRSLCSLCSGRIGFSRSSFIWRLWPEITFSMGAITLGHPSDIFTDPDACPNYQIYCNQSVFDVICSCQGIPQGLAGSPEVPVELTVNYSTVLPENLYNAYVGSQNIYSLWNWPTVVFQLFDYDDTSETPDLYDPPDQFSVFGSCADFAFLFLEPAVSIASSGFRTLWLESDPNSTIASLGINSVRHIAWFLDSVNDIIYIKVYVHTFHVSSLNLFFFLVNSYIFFRWKTADVSFYTPDHLNAWKHNLVQCGFIFVCGIITWYSYLNSDNRFILRDYYLVNLVTYILLLIIIIGLAISFAGFIFIRKTNVEFAFRINFIKNLCVEQMALMSLWLLLLERRGEQLSSIPIFLVNLIVIYSLAYYILLSIIYVIYAGARAVISNPMYILFTVVYLPLWFVYEIWITYRYFGAPIIRNMTSHIGPHCVVPMFIIIIAFLIDLSLYILLLQERKCIRTCLDVIGIDKLHIVTVKDIDKAKQKTVIPKSRKSPLNFFN